MANCGNKESTGANPDKLEGDDAKLDAKDDPDIHLDPLCKEISQFADSISSIDTSQPLETPQYLDKFLEIIESKLNYYESSDSISSSSLFLKSIDCLSLLIESVSKFRSISTSAVLLINLATSLQYRAMLILGEELAILLHNKKHNENQSAHNNSTPRDEQEQEKQESDPDQKEPEVFPPYSSEQVSMISSIANTMISAGYREECNRLFVITRRSAFEEDLTGQGFEKMSIDEVQRMQWETLESDVATWIHVVKRCTTFLFPGELQFYRNVFSSQHSKSKPGSEIWRVLLEDRVRSMIHQLLTLAHAIALTKRSSEKLFKLLDMYQTLRGVGSWLDDVAMSSFTEGFVQEMRVELATAGNRLGEAAVSIFCELENAIKTDNSTKQGAVVGGAIHPLTRYLMNYLKYACEYKGTLEELFTRHAHKEEETPTFIGQLIKLMDLLEASVEAKSKLYKDASLRYIFLMNNGRYMLQKMKVEVDEVESWCRKRSTDVRNYHKNYQRDTWGKVLQCMTQQGLVVNGKVDKPVLKERFKNFNQLFDEIQKTQSSWVVSDEQLKSELRVSISAVMIPAYRAFVARFGPVFTPGRQYEKHIKYQPEDIETGIEELFEGNG